MQYILKQAYYCFNMQQYRQNRENTFLTSNIYLLTSSGKKRMLMIENKKETYQLLVGQSVDKIKALKKVSKNVEERQKENEKWMLKSGEMSKWKQNSVKKFNFYYMILYIYIYILYYIFRLPI